MSHIQGRFVFVALLVTVIVVSYARALGYLLSSDDAFLVDEKVAKDGRLERGEIHWILPSIGPYEKCMRQLEPNEFDPQGHIYLTSGAKARDANLTLRQAFQANQTTIYFLHQRKAGGSTIRTILYDLATEILGKTYTKHHSFIHCRVQGCANFEMPLHETNYLHSVKVVSAHMSYHTPLARSLYEDQVLITNFRDPVSRIKSCMLFRYPLKVEEVFGNANYTHTDGEHLFLHQKDIHQSTCVQEPLRILSPLDPDKEPLSDQNMHKICCMVRAYFHVIQTPPPQFLDTTKDEGASNNSQTLDKGNFTRIEQEIMEYMHTHKRNENKRTTMSNLAQTNFESFFQHIKTHPMVQAENNLYNCVLQRHEHIL